LGDAWDIWFNVRALGFVVIQTMQPLAVLLIIFLERLRTPQHKKPSRTELHDQENTCHQEKRDI
jgi:hypothetical protein